MYFSNTPQGGVSKYIFNPLTDVQSQGGLTLQKDYDDPHHTLTHQINLTNVDDEAMFSAGEQIAHRYNFWLHNCSTVVAKLLMIGFSHRLVGISAIDDVILYLQSGVLLRAPKMHDPDLHNRHVESALDNFEFASMRAAAVRTAPKFKQIVGGMFAVESLGKCFVWYPGQVLRLAQHIKKHGG